MSLHLHGAAPLVESAETRTLDESTPQTSNTASHVHDARSGEIDGSGVEEGSRVEGGEPAELQRNEEREANDKKYRWKKFQRYRWEVGTNMDNERRLTATKIRIDRS